MNDTRLNVMEIFEAFQGEGTRIGQACTFVRLFGCNLRCNWCDTAYSINHSEWKRDNVGSGRSAESPYTVYSPERLLHVIENLRWKHVVITGGEPLIHQAQLEGLLHRLIAKGTSVTIETNCTIWPKWKAHAIGSVFWSLSPKMLSAGGGARIDVEVLHAFSRTNCQFKLVIADEGDLIQAQELVGKFTRLRTPIILQPVTLPTDSAIQLLSKLRALQQGVAKNVAFWSKRDVRVLPQLHVLVHGHERCV